MINEYFSLRLTVNLGGRKLMMSIREYLLIILAMEMKKIISGDFTA